MAKKRVKIPSRPGAKSKKQSQKDVMRQMAQAQEQLIQSQNELNEKEFTATSGGGAVSATVKGSFELKSLTIDPDVVDEDDIEMLEDLVIAAVNEAHKLASEAVEDQTKMLTGGFDIPGLL